MSEETTVNITERLVSNRFVGTKGVAELNPDGEVTGDEEGHRLRPRMRRPLYDTSG